MTEDLVTQLLQGLGAALATAIVALVIQLLRRVSISINAENQAKLQHFVTLGVKYAEEVGRNYVKNRGEKLSSAAKEKVATDFIAIAMPKADPAKVEQMIGAVLSDVRAQEAPAVTVPVVTVSPAVAVPGKAPGASEPSPR